MYRKFLSISAAAILGLVGASAQEAIGDAGAVIVTPLQLASEQSLFFGSIAPSLSVSDSVTVFPSGARDCGVNLTCLTSDHTPASFRVSGEADRSYTVSLPETIKLESASGEIMAVNQFSASRTSGIIQNGQATFDVGGTLIVGANQASGEYNGTFVVTVEYE